MEKTELLQTDSFYNQNCETWQFLKAAYDGYKALIDIGLIDDFKDPAQYKKIGRGYGFSYSKRIIEVTCGFIAGSNFDQDFSSLESDVSWDLFYRDCDLIGTDFDTWWNETREITSTFGVVGILVTQASGGNPEVLKQKGVYPYLSSYSPLDILERRFERDPDTGRPVLTYLKLREYDPDTVIILTRESYETWDISDGKSNQGVLIDQLSGENQLKEIPFIFYFNLKKPGKKFEGLSLIHDIAPVDASMIRSAIRTDKIEHSAAYPIYVTPKEIDDGLGLREIKIGLEEIQEYDPDTPNAKPFWLAPEADKAIEPILKIWQKKREEIYEMSFLSGIITATQSKDSKSADAYKQIFRFLTARLAKMVDSEVEARKGVIKYWLKWQNKEDLFQDINISHGKDFDIEALIETIEDILLEKSMLTSSVTAGKELQKKVVTQGTLADLSQDIQSKIFEEIDNYKPQDLNNLYNPDTGKPNTDDTSKEE